MDHTEQLARRALVELDYAAIDFESAGVFVGENDAPVQVGIVTCDGLYEQPEHFTSYIACHRPIHWAAAQVHGITREDLKDAPSMSTLWPEYRKRLSARVLVAHNDATERRFLQCFPGHGFAPWLDTLKLVRRALPDLSDHSLGHVCDQLDITGEIRACVPHKSWHDAHFDAAACLLLLRSLMRELSMEQCCLEDISFALRWE